jgi:ribosomal protein S18 acetylase RimI-like enzyme
MGVEGETHFVYDGPRFPDPGISPVPYREEFFHRELELESDLFEQMRRDAGITPYRISDSAPDQLEGIARFFIEHKDTFLFLPDDEDLIGSILFLGNRIQSLCVARQHQRRGYGRKLTACAVNAILDGGAPTVVLETLPGNQVAEHLYRSMGFHEVK